MWFLLVPLEKNHSAPCFPIIPFVLRYKKGTKWEDEKKIHYRKEFLV